MIHTKRLLSEPSAEGLSDLMRTQQRLVEEMLFRTIELSALVDSGQHRFIGRALDDLERAERELGRTELVRAAMTEAILGSEAGTEPGLEDILTAIDDDASAAIQRTADQIRQTLGEIDRVRRDTAPTAAERVARTRRAASAATSPAGLYARD